MSEQFLPSEKESTQREMKICSPAANSFLLKEAFKAFKGGCAYVQGNLNLCFSYLLKNSFSLDVA